MTTAERQEQRDRLGSILSLSHALFLQECVRVGLPDNEEESTKLSEKCFIVASAARDYFNSQFEPYT